MTAAILCPGPSLAHRPDATLANYKLRIAVNRATLRYPCHAWVMHDWKSITRITDAPIVPLYTDWTSYETLKGRWNRFADFNIRIIQNRGISAVSALHVARNLGADEIDVYGADWTDAPDFDGVSLVGTVRDQERWKREAGLWDAAVSELGIAVRRLSSPL